MSDVALRRTIRRSTAVVAFALTLLAFHVEHYLASQGIGSTPGVHYLTVALSLGSALYLSASVARTGLRTAE